MALHLSFRVDAVGMTVPYAAKADDIRNNLGYVDLRGNPDKAKEIVEGNDSPALRNLLMRVASVGSPIFTLGCDLGAHQEPTYVNVRRREVAGGYIQVASARYDRTKPESYSSFAQAIGKSVKARAGKNNWKLDCVGTWVDFKIRGEPTGLHPTLTIWFSPQLRTNVRPLNHANC